MTYILAFAIMSLKWALILFFSIDDTRPPTPYTTYKHETITTLPECSGVVSNLLLLTETYLNSLQKSSGGLHKLCIESSQLRQKFPCGNFWWWYFPQPECCLNNKSIVYSMLHCFSFMYISDHLQADPEKKL